MKKATQSKNLLRSDHSEYILEACNGLSVKIVEHAGFKGIRGSGLALSAQHVRLAINNLADLAWASDFTHGQNS